MSDYSDHRIFDEIIDNSFTYDEQEVLEHLFVEAGALYRFVSDYVSDYVYDEESE